MHSCKPAPAKGNKPSSGRPRYHFSSEDKTKKFSEAVHKALLEHCESEVSPEEEHYINMADADGFEELEGDADAASPALDDDESEDQDGGVSALVAAALGNLIKD
jgi:hypothetical protein